MSFWSKTTAAPSLFHLVCPKTPRYLRTLPAPPPHHAEFVSPRRAVAADAPIIATFWHNHYGDSDWMLDIQVARVARTIQQGIVLLLYHSGKLIATIVSSPAAPVAYFSNGAVLRNLRIIEGLCVHRDWRGKSLAGYMIGWMDFVTSQNDPVAHLWSREIPRPGLFSTAIANHIYAYIDSRHALEKLQCYPMNWSEFTNHQKKQRFGKLLSLATGHDKIFFENYENSFGLLTAWKTLDCRQIAVIYNTERRCRSDGRPIYEVIAYYGLSEESAVFLESIAAKYNGIVFASSGKFQGGASPSWRHPWVYGTSGVHAWYIYNYIPPAFGSCELEIIRKDI